MIGRALFGALLQVAATAATWPAAAAAPPVYVELDGRWYHVGNGPAVFWYDGYGFYMPTAGAAGCRRADGQGQAFGGTGLYVGQFFFPVYRITDFAYRSIPQLPGRYVARYASEPRNIVCDNEIPSPLPDALFRNGFDRSAPTDRIFAWGFDP